MGGDGGVGDGPGGGGGGDGDGGGGGNGGDIVTRIVAVPTTASAPPKYS